jgi:hypothetical protein
MRYAKEGICRRAATDASMAARGQAAGRYAAAMQQLRLTRLLANISLSKTCFSFLLSRRTLQEARLLG